MKARDRRVGLRHWLIVLAPLVAAFAQQQVSYGWLAWACEHDSRAAAHLAALLALGLVAIIAFTARPSSHAREPFMAGLAMLACAFSVLLIVAQWMPAFYIHPCQR